MSYLIFATACCKENVYVQYFVVIIIIIMEFLFLHLWLYNLDRGLQSLQISTVVMTVGLSPMM